MPEPTLEEQEKEALRLIDQAGWNVDRLGSRYRAVKRGTRSVEVYGRDLLRLVHHVTSWEQSRARGIGGATPLLPAVVSIRRGAHAASDSRDVTHG